MKHPRGGHVLVVDDDAELCELISLRLEARGMKVTTALTAARGLELLEQEEVDAVVLDLRLEGADGLEVMGQMRARSPDLPVVILTAHGTIETAVEAMQRGAYGFLTKPFQDHELVQKLLHATERSDLRRELADLRRIVAGTTPERLLGTSSAIAEVRDRIARVAPSEATVLILGESGTGKELAARQVHALSRRASGPFVAVNCGALPPELLESELFGHVKGAFTGATQTREGLFGAARGGTLFLDEIGEAALRVQVKLLRVLQERRFARVGSTVEEEADVRIVAATNRDLREEVEAKRFREDLYYRLAVLPIVMPPLRERLEDIPILATRHLEQAAARNGLRLPRLAPEVMDLLRSHSWPGNVRELVNAMEALVLLAPEDDIRFEHVARMFDPPTSSRAPADAAREEEQDWLSAEGELPTLREARDRFERRYLSEVLRRSKGNVAAAARTASRNRTDFYELLRRHGLSPAEFK
ncbi:sigma-54 dependent transcriptional regulator [Myxococcus sp. MISCRS1]|uniref:sigma-54-dependent transcriptional regulator n=1 Tax=Myxococcus TaxID=32 RepID=UPI0011439AA7|nr:MULTISPECIES: sigma-54 dependent transcriptional regulator [Myxococcus]MBZ4398910.1 sigma-54 dependent transcriptional regulator [Myxococcus sp. AS-1-15]MCK8500517.1 sigma-54 dependent transcriptional regulator [Myxococcus fulvus]MCY1002374.1 sigma-54 dependent transcriptional regulator [Myxococcus sp. MISCRS1]